jgi:predicted RNA methylase
MKNYYKKINKENKSKNMKNNSNKLDQFYTKPDIALKYYNKLKELVNINEFDIHLEPSAGAGSFFNIMDDNKKIGLDIDPRETGITEMNFFDYKPENNKRYLVIGNPPFGRVSSLAVKFFNKSAEFSQCIAFIIPRTFKRVSIQNKLNLSFKLIYNEDLPLEPCCFIPKMSAKCCFQIWIRTKEKRKKIIYDNSHKDFSFLKHGPKDENNQPTPPNGCDFVIKAYGGSCGVIRDEELHLLRPKSWHWIKANINTEILKKRFRQLDYSISKDTVRQNSLGQKELIYLYKLKYN